jgi:xanthine dehydrogenase YagR molybdenum-binding subunit
MYLGQGLDRRDGRVKVTGTAPYAAEFKVPGLVHAVLVQSTIGAGSIEGFDLDDAQRHPGVIAIITPENAARLHAEPGAEQAVVHPLLQTKDVFYNGQHVAVVVAETFERAQAGAAAVRVRYRQGEATPTMDGALGSAYTPKKFRNGQAKPDTKVGDVDAGMRDAAVRVEQTYETPVEHHNPMEPHATIARWDGNKLTVWTATQGISGAQKTLSTLFAMKPEDVTIICPYVGGGFGCKGNTWPPAALAAMASRMVGRPVKLVVTREQMFTSNGYRPRTIQKVRLAADRDGKLLAVSHDGLTQMSMPPLGEFAEPVAMASRMMYAAPAISTTHRLVSVNQGLPTYMRAPGESSGMYALESAMDELAVALKIDPLELRLRNYAEKDPTENKPFASKGLRDCYEKGAAAFGWSKRNAEPGAMRDGNTLIGWGMATAVYGTNRLPAKARVTLRADGTALVECGTQDIGTGTYTIIAQAAADALDMPPGRVEVRIGDSRLPPAGVSGGSMTAISVLPAVQDAAKDARAKLAALAQQHDMAGANDPAHVMARAHVEIVAGEAAVALPQAAHDYSRHSFGAHFAEVHVDADFGTVRVARWVGACDVGRILNAKTARSQLYGGIIFGIGMALLEETRVDQATARYTNANIAEYLVPVNADIPAIEVITVEAPDTISSPTGAKGIGELPMVGVAPAIANAVFNATGKRIRKLPIRLDDVI